MKKILTLLAAVMTVLSLSAGNYYLKNNWGGQADSWIELADGGDGTYYADEPVMIGDHDFLINTEATDVDARTIKMENVSAYIDMTDAELSAGDQVFFMYVPEEYSQYDPKASGLMGMITNKNGYALNFNNAWKNMIQDDETFVLFNALYAGKDVKIVTGNVITTIKGENIQAMLNYDNAELAAGDSVMYIFDPQGYSQYDETKSGLIAMITWKNGFAIRENNVWKNMTEDDGTFSTYNTIAVDGNAVQVVTGNNISSIAMENTQALLNYDEAELSVGDSVMYIFDPQGVNQYDPKASGLIAMINWKNGFALKNGAAWKNMIDDDPEEHDWWILNNACFNGNAIQIVSENQIRAIQPENIAAFIDADFAELSAGDTVMFIFRPSMENRYNPAESGMQAMITWKNGFAIRENNVWKNMTEDDGTFSTYNTIAVDGNAVQVVTGNNISSIAMENTQALLNYDNAELSVGDSVMYIFDPEGVSQYDPKASGLIAMINWKNGFALKNGAAWKNMIDDDPEEHDWWILNNACFNGNAIQIVSENQIRAIQPENIAAFIDADFAELSAGDTVMFIFRPSMENRYNPAESGMQAIINWKNGYAIFDGSWKNLIDDDPEEHDWWIIENIVVNGEAIRLVNGNEIRSIAPENVEAYINYELAELSAGDEVMFVYRPSLYNRYDEKESGMYAHILVKNGYAILGTWGENTASWKNMILDEEQEDETYVLNNVIFDGNDVQFVSNEGIRIIKVENIPAYLIDDYHAEAVLEEGDLVMFVYAPDTYNHYDETQSGLSAIILEKHATEGFENIEAEGKAAKVMMNGEIFIIKNGKVFNAMGTMVK